ncbi:MULTISPECIES: MFS transporter [Paenibacillus]|uniref:CP family cyanate transporter-like MFS transporter n=1 Tax=Paenibacillus pabuli TaxID=1472 RepID=A0A855Y3H6_9BACL|nr:MULTISPECIES: MFS transporter [Paenibacillus]PWW35025.1 CP family cyanate transporter-like MFS transporter [Paenibacillus pabuli]PXW01783.1 CP family cyanate transporter-like MFS transporter [Paenibacillus taichungensis]RAI91709.1 CP family cyanate transporter-like MFS transporter [Paenibacillus pabuli]
MKLFYIVLALILASLNLRPPITSISPLMSTIQSDLGISGIAASLLTTLPVLCMGIFAPFSVKLSRRWGNEGAIVLALILIGVGTALRLFVGAAPLMMFTSFLSGVGIALAGPLLSSFIKQYFPTRVAAMVGVYSTAMVVGASISVGLSVPLQNLLGGSWKGSLAMWALLAIIALPIWMKLALSARKDRQTGQISTVNVEALPVKNSRAWVLTLFFGLMAAIFYSLTAWLAPAIQSQGYTKETAGSIQTLFTLISLPSTLFIPMLVHRYQKRVFWLVGCALMELIGVLMLNLSVSPWLAAIPLGIGAGGLFPIALMLPIDETNNAQEASAWSAMTQSGGYILGALGPLAIGWLHDTTGSFVQAFYGLAIIIVLQIMVQLAIGNKKSSPAVHGKSESRV